MPSAPDGNPISDELDEGEAYPDLVHWAKLARAAVDELEAEIAASTLSISVGDQLTEIRRVLSLVDADKATQADLADALAACDVIPLALEGDEGVSLGGWAQILDSLVDAFHEIAELI